MRAAYNGQMVTGVARRLGYVPRDIEFALAEFPDGGHCAWIAHWPFLRTLDLGVTSVNYNFAELLTRAEERS